MEIEIEDVKPKMVRAAHEQSMETEDVCGWRDEAKRRTRCGEPPISRRSEVGGSRRPRLDGLHHLAAALVTRGAGAGLGTSASILCFLDETLSGAMAGATTD